MDQEFFFDHGGRQAAQDVESQQGFDLPEVEFYGSIKRKIWLLYHPFLQRR
jgi:hypothetical protein